MPALDTSVLVPLFDRDHRRHAEASKAFSAADDVIVHPAVLAETATVLRRILKAVELDGGALARDAIRRLVLEPRCGIEGVDDRRALDRYLRNRRLSLAYAYVAEARWHHDKAAPVAFDEEILKEAALQ